MTNFLAREIVEHKLKNYAWASKQRELLVTCFPNRGHVLASGALL